MCGPATGDHPSVQEPCAFTLPLVGERRQTRELFLFFPPLSGLKEMKISISATLYWGYEGFFSPSYHAS